MGVELADPAELDPAEAAGWAASITRPPSAGDPACCAWTGRWSGTRSTGLPVSEPDTSQKNRRSLRGGLCGQA